MDPDWSVHTQASSPSKINTEQVRMDTRRDSAVGIASANSETAPPPLSSHNSQHPPGNTDHTTHQHDFVPDSPTQAEKTTETSKAKKKKKKKKGKGATTTGTLNPTDVSSRPENFESPDDTNSDTNGTGQYQPPDGDDLEWLESSVVKGDTKPTGKKSKTKKKPTKRNDAKKVVEKKDGDRISATDEENDQESEGKVDDTQEVDDTIDSQNNIDTEEHKGTPTDSLAFIEDDSFMNEGGASNWADDMAELDPQPWGEMSLGGQGNSAADQGSPITPPSSTSSSIASSSALVSWTPPPDDVQESRSASMPTAQPQDARLYERQDRRPSRQDYRGQPRPPRPPCPPRPPRSHPKDSQVQAQRSHYPSNYSERPERLERPSPMRPRPERHQGYETWAPTADPRDHHVVSQIYSNQRQPKSHPLPPRPDVPFAGAHVPPHHHPSGHPGHTYPGQGFSGQGHPGYGHPGYLVDSDPHFIPGHDRLFHSRLPRPKPGYGMFAADAPGSSSRQDIHWRRQAQQQQQQQQRPQQPQRKHQQQRLEQQEQHEEQPQQHEDAKTSPPTQYAMTEEAPEPFANGTIAPSEPTTTSDHVDGDEVVSDPALGTETPGRPRAIMGLAMIGRQLAPWEDRDQVIEMLNRRWEQALRSVSLDGSTTAKVIFYTSDM
ncbi:hypothetical protein BGZ74_008774 [Mortierella antarctica]|nr:hypothetical protein BGZ74_008774 [Mortierella antarctica]